MLGEFGASLHASVPGQTLHTAQSALGFTALKHHDGLTTVRILCILSYAIIRWEDENAMKETLLWSLLCVKISIFGGDSCAPFFPSSLPPSHAWR